MLCYVMLCYAMLPQCSGPIVSLMSNGGLLPVAARPILIIWSSHSSWVQGISATEILPRPPFHPSFLMELECVCRYSSKKQKNKHTNKKNKKNKKKVWFVWFLYVMVLPFIRICRCRKPPSRVASPTISCLILTD